jgi:hypothetical protein
MSITYSEVLIVALDILHSTRVRHIVFCSLPSCTVFLHIIPRTARFSDNALSIMKCAFWFSTSAIIIETDIINNGLHAQYRLLLLPVIIIIIGYYYYYRLLLLLPVIIIITGYYYYYRLLLPVIIITRYNYYYRLLLLLVI